MDVVYTPVDLFAFHIFLFSVVLFCIFLLLIVFGILLFLLTLLERLQGFGKGLKQFNLLKQLSLILHLGQLSIHFGEFGAIGNHGCCVRLQRRVGLLALHVLLLFLVVTVLLIFALLCVFFLLIVLSIPLFLLELLERLHGLGNGVHDTIGVDRRNTIEGRLESGRHMLWFDLHVLLDIVLPGQRCKHIKHNQLELLENGLARSWTQTERQRLFEALKRIAHTLREKRMNLLDGFRSLNLVGSL